MSNIDKQDFVTIGVITGVYGIKGNVKVKSYTQPSNAFLNYKSLYWNYSGSWEPMPVVANSICMKGSNIVLAVKDCQDRDLAKEYKSSSISIKRADLPKLAPNEYYWADLEGLDVYTTYCEDCAHSQHSQDNKVQANLKQYLGRVDHLFETGSNDVLVVKSELETSSKTNAEPNSEPCSESNSKNKQYLIPYVLNKYILSIDLEAKQIIVDWDPDF